MATDNIAGHTAAQNTLGEDGLRDGDSLSPTTLTNALQGIQGNGILRYQDGAFGSTRNDTNTGNQPGSMIRATASTLTVSGGFAVLDGALYEFGTGVGDTITLDLNDASHGSGALSLSSNQEAVYTIYVAPSGGVNKVYYEGGSPVATNTGLYPSASNQYLINYKALSTGDNAKAIALAQVRVQFIASGGGSNNLNIVEINDKRVFIEGAADYRVPLSTGTISSGTGSSVAEIADGGAQGINTIAHLNAIHNDNGELAITDTVNVHWVSHPRYGAFAQTPPGSTDAGYGQGPSRGADRGGSHAADSFYFAGRNNEQTGHYAVRLQGRGVDATSTALTTNGTWVVTADGDSFFMLSPNGGVTITLNPERDADANYKFPEGHIIEVCNDGAGSIVFDNQTTPSGLNATLLAGHRATFIYEGTAWVRCDYQSAIIAAGPTPAIFDNSGTPAFTTGITKAEVQTLLNIEDNADVTDTANVTAAGALMDSELTDLAGVKGVTISTLQVKPSEGAFANGDKTKLDGIPANATANAGTVTGVTGTLPISSTGGATPAISIAAATTTAAGSMSGADKTKLDDIEADATADQTNAEIRAAVEAATDSNVFTDTDHSKLNAIEASATADQTNAEIRAAVEAATDSNVFTDTDHSKLNAIEALADVTDATNVDAAGAVMESDVDAKGDVFVATANNTLTRLAVGTNNHVLTADSAQASGVKWAAVSGGGGGATDKIEDADNDTKIEVETSSDDDKIIMTSAGTDIVEVTKGALLNPNSVKLLNATALTFHATDSASNSLSITCPTTEMAAANQVKSISINQGTTAGDTLLTAAGVSASANSAGGFGNPPILDLGVAGTIGGGVFTLSKLHALTLQSTIFTANRIGALNDTGQYIVMTGSGLTYSLVANASLGAQLTILAGSSNAVTVTATGSKTINGGSANGSITVAGYNGVTLICIDASNNWLALGV